MRETNRPEVLEPPAALRLELADSWCACHTIGWSTGWSVAGCVACGISGRDYVLPSGAIRVL